MIRPSQTLLIATAAIAIPLATVAGLAPAWAPACLAALGLGFAIAAVDGFRATRALGEWSASAPPLLRWFKDRADEFPLTLQNRAGAARKLRVQVAFPAEIAVEQKTMALRVDGCNGPEGPGAGVVNFAATPRRRGNYQLTACNIEQRSPFGLWFACGSLALESQIRVFPDLRREHAADLVRLRSLDGNHRRRQLGKGREFEKLREYGPGDSFEDIDWKATARRRHPVVKVFQIERTQEIYAIIDASRLSARGDALEHWVSAALTLGAVAESQHDRFGLATFSAGVDRLVPAASGKRHFAECRDAIYALQPRPVTPDLEDVFSFLHARLRKRSLLIFLTALDDPILAESFLRDIGVLSRRHLVLVNVPAQKEAQPLFTGPLPESPDEMYTKLAGHMDWTRVHELQSALRLKGVRLAMVNPRELAARMARQYLDIKQEQLL